MPGDSLLAQGRSGIVAVKGTLTDIGDADRFGECWPESAEGSQPPRAANQ